MGIPDNPDDHYPDVVTAGSLAAALQAVAAQSGPTSEWQHMRTEAGEADWPEYQELIEAAYAAPTLRALYPFTSHWTLRFSTSTRPHLTPFPPCLAAPRREGRYTLSALGEVITEATTADEAVEALLRHMHSSPGTVTFGAAPEPAELEFEGETA